MKGLFYSRKHCAHKKKIMDGNNVFFLLLHWSRDKGGKRKERNGCQSHIRSLTLAHAFLREKARRDDFEGFKKDNHRFIEEATIGASTSMASSHVGVWNASTRQLFLFFFSPIIFCQFNLITCLSFFFLSSNFLFCFNFNLELYPTCG